MAVIVNAATAALIASAWLRTAITNSRCPSKTGCSVAAQRAISHRETGVCENIECTPLQGRVIAKPAVINRNRGAVPKQHRSTPTAGLVRRDVVVKVTGGDIGDRPGKARINCAGITGLVGSELTVCNVKRSEA